jgi:hypothetical protein
VNFEAYVRFGKNIHNTCDRGAARDSALLFWSVIDHDGEVGMLLKALQMIPHF